MLEIFQDYSQQVQETTTDYGSTLDHVYTTKYCTLLDCEIIFHRSQANYTVNSYTCRCVILLKFITLTSNFFKVQYTLVTVKPDRRQTTDNITIAGHCNKIATLG